MPRLLGLLDRRITVLALLLVSFAIALPVVSANVVRSSDATFFDTWDRESQALVLARVEQARADSAPTWGLTRAEPDIFAPERTFDSGAGAPRGAVYTTYESQLGLQGLLFTGLDAAGCSTVGCLTTASATLFALALIAFVVAIAAVSTRSLATVVLVTSLLSPWVVASARNLYWVPWTWLLPAIAAAALVRAGTRSRRWIAGAALYATVALKAGSGYEFITSVILLAVAMPVLAAAFGRVTRREAIRDGLIIAGLAAAAFLGVLLAHAVEAGAGSFPAGVDALVGDATRRTWGPARAGLDQGTLDSLRVGPWTVLGIYTFGWQTDLLDIGVGTRAALTIGRWGLPALLALCLAAVATSAVLRRPQWRRDLVLLAASAAPPLSWFVLAKSHAYSAVGMCYVLWYWLLVPVGAWVVGVTALAVLRPFLVRQRKVVAA